MRRIVHFGIILSSLFIFLGIPAIFYAGRFKAIWFSDAPDAVSGATLEIPDQPSGEYIVLLNRSLHEDTLDEWTSFFMEEPVGVIFEDLTCITAEGDVNGQQMAERYQARLAENQMTMKPENALIAASKAQWGTFDVMVFSKEMADACHLETVHSNPDVSFLEIGS